MFIVRPKHTWNILKKAIFFYRYQLLNIYKHHIRITLAVKPKCIKRLM